MKRVSIEMRHHIGDTEEMTSISAKTHNNRRAALADWVIAQPR
jgi:hypothetical protein